jgi:hypothetical protein
MKKILGFLVLTLALVNTAQAEMVEGVEINRSAQGINFTHSIDMAKYNTAGVQAVYSDGTPAAHTLTNGVKEAATITVVNNSNALISAQASVQINIQSTTSVNGDYVTLNGIVFTEDVHWTALTSSATAAASLATVIDAHPDFSATSAANSSTVTVSYITYGTSGNGLPAATSDANNLPVSASTFGSGVNQYTVTINGVTLTEGEDFDSHATSRTAAGNLTTAINDDSTLSTQVTASSGTSGSVITITALYPGINNYYAYSSTTGFSISNFSPGAATEIDIENDQFNQSAHGLTTGLQVLYSTVAASTIGGLTNQTTYYAIKLTEDAYQLATSSTNAVAGTEIDLTSIPATATTYTITPAPLSLAANTGFYWQGSNDNSNFSNLSVSSVTYTAAGNTLWDLDQYAYRYLRAVFLGPTRGGIALAVRIFGREE